MLGYPTDHPVQKFIKKRVSMWDRFRIWVASIVHELLMDKTVEKEGLLYLDKVLRHHQT